MNEIFKDVIGYEGLYHVSNFGRFKALEKKIKHKCGGYAIRKEKIMNLNNFDGYLGITLRANGKNKRCKVHRLIAIAFIPNPNNYPEINHINGIKTDNRIENIEWCNHTQNMRHAVKMGLRPDFKGEKNNNAKLNYEKVYSMKERHRVGVSTKRLSEEYGITQKSVCRILQGKRWPHVILKTA